MKTDDDCPIEGGYVVMPRSIVSKSRNGDISNPERNLLLWIRLTADLRGVSHCNMQGLADEAFNSKVSTSYVNKLLRSLKKKRLLFYRDRNGRRGVFEVHLPDWLLKGGLVKEIDNLFEKELVKAQTEIGDKPLMKPEPVTKVASQSIEESKEAIRTILSKTSKV